MAGEEECIQFWNRRGLKDVTRCALVQFGNTNQDNNHQDLQQWFRQQQQQQQQQRSREGEEESRVRVLCIYMVRFWNQNLLEFLANYDDDCGDGGDSALLLEPGTLVAVSQFAKPYAGAPWPFEHPKVRSTIPNRTMFLSLHVLELYRC